MNEHPEPVSLDPAPGAATTLWLLRHAEVEERYQSVFGGRIDMALSPLGRRQAEALADYLKHCKLDVLYASPMQRVAQTLAPILKVGLPQPTVLSDLREVDFGDWTGLAWEEVERQFGISPYRWLDQLDCGGIRNAECAADFRKRLQPCLESILKTHPGRQIGIACHGGVIRMLLSILLEVPFIKTCIFEVEYASITQVVLQEDRALLQLHNFTPWRDLKA